MAIHYERGGASRYSSLPQAERARICVLNDIGIFICADILSGERSFALLSWPVPQPGHVYFYSRVRAALEKLVFTPLFSLILYLSLSFFFSIFIQSEWVIGTVVRVPIAGMGGDDGYSSSPFYLNIHRIIKKKNIRSIYFIFSFIE